MTRASQAGLPVSCPQCGGPFSGWHPMFTTAAVVKTGVGCVGCGRRWVITTTLRPERESDRPQPVRAPRVGVPVRRCEVCEREMPPGMRPHARYCGKACRSKAERQRQGAA